MLQRFVHALSIAALCLTFAGPAGANTVLKAQLQATVQQHIERQMVDGAVLHLDSKQGEVIELYPSQAHTSIFQMDDHFVLCAELRDKTGRKLPLDVYLARRGKSFVVFRAEIGNRAVFDSLYKRGLIKAF